MISIVLADDHAVVRQGLRAILEAETDFTLVGEAGEGLETLRLVEKLQPNVLVADLMMPGLNGLEVIRQVRRLSKKTRVAVLSMYSTEAYVLEALRNGASAYVPKGSTAAELIRAVREIAAGRRYLSPPLSEPAIEAYLGKTQSAGSDPYDTLTTREREVMQLLAEGHRNAEVADRLFISTRTVETHRANVMRKLSLRNYSALVRYALEKGLLPKPPQ
ncbi:MAG: response regulator [Candidatus Binatia bacterium]